MELCIGRNTIRCKVLVLLLRLFLCCSWVSVSVAASGPGEVFLVGVVGGRRNHWVLVVDGIATFALLKDRKGAEGQETYPGTPRGGSV